MLAIKYTLFAILATGVNLLFQWFSFQWYEGVGSLYVAMLFGTLAGLVAKYLLDKRYIFYHTPVNKKDDAQKFLLYAMMGVLTTVIFWGTEIAFDRIFEAESAKYFGAALGLSVGYVTKFYLDKKFVFIHKEEAMA
jgi:putative flippase GtrA